jgi:hypothetical protein
MKKLHYVLMSSLLSFCALAAPRIGDVTYEFPAKRVKIELQHGTPDLGFFEQTEGGDRKFVFRMEVTSLVVLTVYETEELRHPQLTLRWQIEGSAKIGEFENFAHFEKVATKAQKDDAAHRAKESVEQAAYLKKLVEAQSRSERIEIRVPSLDVQQVQFTTKVND